MGVNHHVKYIAYVYIGCLDIKFRFNQVDLCIALQEFLALTFKALKDQDMNVPQNTGICLLLHCSSIEGYLILLIRG